MYFETQVQLPQYIENITDKLAENIHEQWSMSKIEQGYSFGEVRSPAVFQHHSQTQQHTTVILLNVSRRCYW